MSASLNRNSSSSSSSSASKGWTSCVSFVCLCCKCSAKALQFYLGAFKRICRRVKQRGIDIRVNLQCCYSLHFVPLFNSYVHVIRIHKISHLSGHHVSLNGRHSARTEMALVATKRNRPLLGWRWLWCLWLWPRGVYYRQYQSIELLGQKNPRSLIDMSRIPS